MMQGKIEKFPNDLSKADDYHVIEKSAILQSFFHQIIPFNYGTGTTAGLVTKWLLNEKGYHFALDLNSYEVKYYRKCTEKA